jgi:FixJ family two-component response regulator
LCESISNLLTFSGYMVRAYTEAAAFLAQLPNTAPAVVVTDMRMPGMDGLGLHEALQAAGRLMPVIYLSGESTVQQSIRAMKLGALDFLVKPFTREALLSAVAAGIEKDRQNMQQVIAQARYQQALAGLAPRERQVHGLLVQGYNNNEIMNELGISLYTAKQYKSEVMRKLGVRSLSHLIKMSAERSEV